MISAFVDKSQCRHRTLFPGVEIYTAPGQELLLSLVEMRPGAVVELHAHPHEQVGMVVEGEARFFIGDEEKVLRAGDLYRIAGNVPHRVVALERGAKALDVFHPIREDYV